MAERREDPLTGLDPAYSFGETCCGEVGPLLVTEAKAAVEQAPEEVVSSSEYPVQSDQPGLEVGKKERSSRVREARGR